MTAKEAREIAETSAAKEVNDLLNEIKTAAQKSQTSIDCNPSEAAIIILRRKGFEVDKIPTSEHKKAFYNYTKYTD